MAILTGHHPFRCQRCGWRGRRKWTDKDLRRLLDYGAGGAETDPALALLDDGPRHEQQEGRVSREALINPEGEHFDLGALGLVNEDQVTVEGTPGEEQAPVQRKRYRRRNFRPSRRALAAGIAATALIMLLVLILSLA